jgi:hypothetical protein
MGIGSIALLTAQKNNPDVSLDFHGGFDGAIIVKRSQLTHNSKLPLGTRDKIHVRSLRS